MLREVRPGAVRGREISIFMRSPRRELWICSMTVGIALSAGCQALRWPWSGERFESGPAAVQELIVSAPDGAASPSLNQFWVRNTLVIDLQSVAGSGQARLAPKPGAAWPVRIAFRVRPGAFGALEVRGEQRVVMPIAPEGGEFRDLELAPGLYTSSTEVLVVGWTPHVVADQSPGS
jgi:hypothetical protein